MSPEARLNLALLVALAAGETFRSYLPPLYELRESDGTSLDPALRGSEAHAIGYALVIGGVVSVAAGTPWPLYGAVAAAGLMFAQYEWAMQADG